MYEMELKLTETDAWIAKMRSLTLEHANQMKSQKLEHENELYGMRSANAATHAAKLTKMKLKYEAIDGAFFTKMNLKNEAIKADNDAKNAAIFTKMKFKYEAAMRVALLLCTMDTDQKANEKEAKRLMKEAKGIKTTK